MITKLIDIGKPDTFDILVNEFLRDELVVVPTETVYGLAANACSDNACRRIYSHKARPVDNPLIVHCSDVDMLARCLSDDCLHLLGYINSCYEQGLSVSFVAKASHYTSSVGRAALPSIAVRIPQHKQFRALIAAFGKPLAAPSANPSGSPSAVNPMMAWEYFNGRVPYIVDGGTSTHGLESTVVDLRNSEPVILRDGASSRTELKQIFGTIRGSSKKSNTSPGTRYAHYEPNTALLLLPSLPLSFMLDEKTTFPQGDLTAYQKNDMQNYSVGKAKDSVEVDSQKIELFKKINQVIRTRSMAGVSLSDKIALICGPQSPEFSDFREIAAYAQQYGLTLCMYKRYKSWQEYASRLFSDFSELDASEAKLGVFEYPDEDTHFALVDRLKRAAGQI